MNLDTQEILDQFCSDLVSVAHAGNRIPFKALAAELDKDRTNLSRRLARNETGYPLSDLDALAIMIHQHDFTPLVNLLEAFGFEIRLPRVKKEELIDATVQSVDALTRQLGSLIEVLGRGK